MTGFSNEQISQLRKLFRKELSLEISTEEACQHAAQLVELLLATYRETPNNSPP